MKLHVPIYYNEFHCIAEKCKSNCCKAGWEIDIDDKTANIYKETNGEFGEKLRKNINFGKTNSFILNEKNNCPFLNNKNLCEIIIRLGEENLCQICTEHPRFYEWFNGIKEGGIGLCCEEAARIILSQNKPFKISEIEIPYENCDEYDEEIYNYISNARNKIISYLNDSAIPLNSRIRDVLWYSYTIQQNINSNLLDDEEIFSITPYTNTDLAKILQFFISLEPNNENWIPYLKNCINLYKTNYKLIEEFENSNPEISKYLENISIYFIWRYFLKGVFDEDIISKASFMAISIAIIKCLLFCSWLENKTLTFDKIIEIVKNYSEEIEYSEKNLELIYDAIYEIEDFSIENIIGLFE